MRSDLSKGVAWFNFVLGTPKHGSGHSSSPKGPSRPNVLQLNPARAFMSIINTPPNTAMDSSEAPPKIIVSFPQTFPYAMARLTSLLVGIHIMCDYITAAFRLEGKVSIIPHRGIPEIKALLISPL